MLSQRRLPFSRLLSALLLSLAFSCAPATQQTPADVAPNPIAPNWLPDTVTPDAPEARYAQPPPSQKAPTEDEGPSINHADSGRLGAGRGRSEMKAEPPAAPSRSSSADKAAVSESAKRESPRDDASRPGLGTTWGETRYSQVNEVPFERDDARPTYTGSLHYNDARGARAMSGVESGSSAAISIGNALTLSVRSEWGSTLSAYRAQGRTIAIGEAGQRYSLVVHNRTNERFEVVVSVDGLDVLDGREAGFHKRGYLIEPFATVEIEGFRQSESAVAAFRFGSVRDSYAAQTGSVRNVGVIGVAAFGERGYLSRLRAYQDRVYAESRDTRIRKVADPFPSKWAPAPLTVIR
jgi:hypothetical protein